MIDRYGRCVRDLRVSLTDRCNLRCLYCMPEEGPTFIPRRQLLDTDEIIRLIRLAVFRLGITKIRFTGGEPLLHPDLESIVAATPRGVDIALTTNGVRLAKQAEALQKAGLQRVNISLDSANRETYAQITGRDQFEQVVEGIREAVRLGLSPVKINAVLLPGLDEESAADLVAFCLRERTTLRFIEYMPLGPRGRWSKQAVVSGEDMLNALRQSFDFTPLPHDERGSAPAALWKVKAGTYKGSAYPEGYVGFISSVTQPFCRDCDRTRLTADGAVRSCLFSDQETDLRSLVRSGATDDEIAQAWSEAMWRKPRSHGMDSDDFEQPQRAMYEIGG